MSLQGEFDAAKGGTLAIKLARARAQQRLFGGRAAPVTVGRFEIIDQIGAGGMGSVYAARDPKLDRRVALKFLDPRPGVSADELRQRLGAEARALAAVNHHNVVAVHSIEEDDAQVFIAMELVEGTTLREWLASGRSTADVVGLFAAVADALGSAHAEGVIHGDFKPDNVMVGAGDRPRVLDFGLATSVAEVTGVFAESDDTLSPSSSSSSSTAGGTVAYAAPEQLETGTRDERTDQFSFCVALLEAVTGVLPKASAASTGAAPLRSAPGWLQRIAERGLEEDPDRRWQGMTAVRDALTKGPRKRVALAVAGVAGLGLATVFLTIDDPVPCSPPQALWNAATATRVKEAFTGTTLPVAGAAFARAGARAEAWETSWSAAYVESCEQARGQPNRSHDRKLACLQAGRGAFGELVDAWASADVFTVSRVDSTLRLLDDPERCAETAPDIPAALTQTFARAALLEATGRYEEGLEELATAAGDVEIAGPHAHARYLYLRGELLLREGDYEPAESALTRSYHLALEQSDDVRAAAAAIYLVAAVGERQARHEEGLQWGRHAEAALAKIDFPDADTAAYHNNVGGVYYRQAKYHKAIEHLTKAAELWTSSLGPDAPDVAAAMDNLGAAHAGIAAYDKALEFTRRALAIREAALGPEHPEVAATLHNLGAIFNRIGKYADAIEPLTRASAIRHAKHDPNHPRVAETLLVLGDAHDGLGKYDAAEDYYTRAQTIYRRALEPDHPSAALPTISLGNVAFHRDDPGKARTLYLEGLEIQRRVLGEEHPTAGITLLNIAACSGVLEDYGASAAHYRNALAIFEKALGKDHPHVGSTLKGLGTVLRLQGNATEAVETLERSLALLEKHAVPPISVADAKATLAHALWDAKKDRKRALDLAADARTAFVDLGPRAASDLAELDAWLETIGEAKRRERQRATPRSTR